MFLSHAYNMGYICRQINRNEALEDEIEPRTRRQAAVPTFPLSFPTD